jgi:predicted nucleotidyltransferase
VPKEYESACQDAIFGSTARDEARADSDVDVLLELDNGRRFSLIDLSEIKFLLGDLVGGRVDVALRGRLRPEHRAAIEKDAVPVF